MPLPKDQAWFPAKKYGWGWGPPTRWQGIVVLITYLGALIAGSLFILPHSLPAFLGLVFAMSLILVAICYAKGEAPRWRWGDDETP